MIGDMNNNHPRFWEILSIVDYYSWSCTNALKALCMPDKRTGLDRMIDKATGYDKAQKEEKMKNLKGLIIALKSKAKFEEIINHIVILEKKEII